MLSSAAAPWTQITYANGSWVENSSSPENADLTGDLFVSFAYFVIGLGFFILVHSFIINKFHFSIVRTCTDAACVSTICQTFCLLQCAVKCTPIQSVVWVNILANASFSAIVQGCDNYITFARYAVVVDWKISKSRYYLTLAYVVINLYFSWWPFFTLAPLIASMNTEEAKATYTALQYYWNFPTYCMFNFYHSYLLYVEILGMRNQQIYGLDTTRLEVMALKSILHDMVSVAAIACYAFTYPLGASLQDILIMVALHCIFNWKKPTRWMENALQRVKVGDSSAVAVEVQRKELSSVRE
jgi:hypothetical protein